MATTRRQQNRAKISILSRYFKSKPKSKSTSKWVWYCLYAVCYLAEVIFCSVCFLVFLSFNEFRLQPFADRTVCVFVPWCILIETIKCMRRPIFDGRHIYAVWYEHTNQKKTNNGLTEPQDKIEQTQWKGSQKLKMIANMLNSFQIICISMVNWLWRCGSAFNVFFCFLFFDYIVAKRQWHSFTYIFDAKASNSCAAFQMAWNFYWIHISCECEI